MKKPIWEMMAVLFATVLVISACGKGKTGPAGPTGEGPSEAPLCVSPAQQGQTVLGTMTDPAGAGMLYSDQVVLANPGTAISLSLYVANAGAVTGQVRMGIYNDNGGSPGNLIVETIPHGLSPSSWNTIDLPVDVYLPAGTYWVAMLFSNTGAELSFAVPGGHYHYLNGYGWSMLPPQYPTSPAGTARVSLYINVCP